MAEQQIKRPRGTTDYYGEQEKLFLALDSILKAEAKAYERPLVSFRCLKKTDFSTALSEKEAISS